MQNSVRRKATPPLDTLPSVSRGQVSGCIFGCCSTVPVLRLRAAPVAEEGLSFRQQCAESSSKRGSGYQESVSSPHRWRQPGACFMTGVGQRWIMCV